MILPKQLLAITRGAFVKGHIALIGGDEFRLGCEPMDRQILAATGLERPSMLLVPTAAATQNPLRAVEDGKKYFSGLGADVSKLMVLDATDANDEALLSSVDHADIVYLTGGDPIYLLKALRGSALLTKMIRALSLGAILVGSSAGAMVLGSWMRPKKWRPGLGVIPRIAVFPHHECVDPDAVSRKLTRSAPDSLIVLGIDAGTGCLGCQEGWRVIGLGGVTVYRSGVWTRYSSGDLIHI